MHVKYLIIGAGPTGLGAGRRLKELGREDFLILEKNPTPGGLARSFKDGQGFTWDIGGHVVFSHYPYFDDLLDELLGRDYLAHERVAMVRLAGRWIPYPFQNNIRRLPRDLTWECVQGLLPGRRPEKKPENFAEWINFVFGPGLARLFMLPYNFKVWATPPELMDFNWIGERVSVIDLEMVLKNIILELDDHSWGPNNLFRFPKTGGTGEIFTRLARALGDGIRTGEEAARLDPKNKTLGTKSGAEYSYDYLLNTGPLDLLVLDLVKDAPQAMRTEAERLAHNGVHVAGVGTRAHRPDDKCWMYFPEDNCPFYRLTNFHNYSPLNTPDPGRCRGLMSETSFSGHKPEDLSKLMDRTISGLANVSMLEPGERDKISSTWEMSVEYGYPVPTLERDPALARLIPWLEGMDVFSRGRFGGWKYEVGNMDHCLMQGVEWAERMVLGETEQTYAV